jgi:CheY-like chemotaxis protein
VSEAAPFRLLVVDDNEMNRDVLTRRLRKHGHEVATAENGLAALEMLGGGGFDLVLLDVMMPELDGREALARMKADESLRHIPVIMISASEELETVVRCIELGAEDYLPKPFNPTLLKARVDASLEKKRLRGSAPGISTTPSTFPAVASGSSSRTSATREWARRCSWRSFGRCCEPRPEEPERRPPRPRSRRRSA